MLTRANNSPEGRRKPGRRCDGRFLGFWARLNCENMAVIPAWIVRSNLDDPRKMPYLLVWKDERDGRIMEAVRLMCRVDPYLRSPHRYVEIKRTDESTTVLRIVLRMLPRNGGRPLFLLCPHCNTPRRHVYGWNGTAFRDGRTESGVSVVDAALAPGCATLPKAAICAEAGVVHWVLCFALFSETYLARSRGFLRV